jgi:hypothetical protein
MRRGENLCIFLEIRGVYCDAPAFDIRPALQKPSIPPVRTVLGLACAALACAAAVATGSPAAPEPAQLAALAFPGWSDSPAGRIQTVTLPPPRTTHDGYASWNAGANRVLADPRVVLRVDATHLTLIAGLTPAREDGKPAASQLAPMALAAYQFELRDGAWNLAGRQGIFAFRGFSGTAALRAVALSGQHPGLAVEYGSCWDGYCGTWLALYELKDGTVRREPAVELALSGVNVDSAADCQHRLQPLVKARLQDSQVRDDGGPPDSHDCYAIDGSWSIDLAHEAHDEPGDLVLRYQGAMSHGEAHMLAPVAVDQRQVLRYGGGKYRAVSGFDPVPPI